MTSIFNYMIGNLIFEAEAIVIAPASVKNCSKFAVFVKRISDKEHHDLALTKSNITRHRDTIKRILLYRYDE